MLSAFSSFPSAINVCHIFLNNFMEIAHFMFKFCELLLLLSSFCLQKLFIFIYMVGFNWPHTHIKRGRNASRGMLMRIKNWDQNDFRVIVTRRSLP